MNGKCLFLSLNLFGSLSFIIMKCFLICSALVWGSSVKHQPQKCGKDHQLNDEDVVQIVKK